MWEVITSLDSQVGRTEKHNVMKDWTGPISYAKQSIVEGSIMSAFCLFIDKIIVDIIVNCTIFESQIKTYQNNWKTSIFEIQSLLAVMFARGLLAKGKPVDYIWSKK